MSVKRTTGTLHLLTARQVQLAGGGDHADGGGLLLRTSARDAAQRARELLRMGKDLLDERAAGRAKMREAEQAKKAEKAREQWTLCRAARDYHERVIEPTKTTKHSADWINSLENHLPAALWHKPIGEIESRPPLPDALDLLDGAIDRLLPALHHQHRAQHREVGEEFFAKRGR
jgi:hypothetical protein